MVRALRVAERHVRHRRRSPWQRRRNRRERLEAQEFVAQKLVAAQQLNTAIGEAEGDLR